MEPIRTDFKGYEGQYVAMDARTGVIVIADKDPRVVLEKAKGRNHVMVRGRVPYPNEPTPVGLASRFAQAIAIEDRNAFDERFGTVLSV
jgi:hypothetical protein